MNIAVNHGAEKNQRFVEYVDYLAEQGHIPTASKEWVDQIRQLGNDATHEIPQIDSADATQILEFSTMMLRLVYDYPQRIGRPES